MSWVPRSVVAVTAVVVPLGAVVLGLPTLWTQGALLLVEIGCVIVAATHIGRHQLQRSGWVAVVAGAGSVALASVVIFVSLELADRRPADWAVLTLRVLGSVLVLAGACLVTRARPRWRPQQGDIESLIFCLGALAPVLALVVLPQLHRHTFPGGDSSSTTAVVVWAIVDVLVLAIAARTAFAGHRDPRAAFLLSGALFVSFAAGVIAGAAGATAPGHSPVSARILSMVSFVLLAAGVTSVRDRSTHAMAVDPVALARRQVWMLSGGLALPGVSLAATVFAGSTRDVAVVAVVLLLVAGLAVSRFASLLRSLTSATAELARLAESDETTDLPNRRGWDQRLERTCADATRSGARLCVAVFELDGFPGYVDRFGHQAGVGLLRQTAAVWHQALGEGEILARFAGSQFALLMPGIPLAEAVGRVDQLRRVLPATASASAGVAEWADGADPAHVMVQASGALYAAQAGGRDRTMASEGGPGMLPAPLRDIQIALQPIVRTVDLTTAAYEGLSRFPHSTAIEAVFEDAHERGFGDLLEATAVARVADLADRPDGVAMFVNVSERAMRSARFWNRIPADLTGLVVEVLEKRDGLSDRELLDLLRRFRRRGARIALDDVGSASTDFARIAALRPDIAKIDRSLVAGCDACPSRAEVLHLLVNLALSHDAEVVVEGIETPGELDVARAAGATYAQGYLLGRPGQSWLTGQSTESSPLVVPVGGA